MWRAVIAMIHADGVVTSQELSFLTDHLKDLHLTEEQMETVKEDIQTPQSAQKMFENITNSMDQRDFFALARAVSWCDGDYDQQEQLIINTLEKDHLNAEAMNMLEDTREIIQEVDLCENQWNFKTERSRNLFGFLKKKTGT